MNRDRHQPGFWIGLFIGGLLAGMTIVIMTTKEGKKIAKELWEKIRVYIEDVEEHFEEVEKGMHEKTEEITEKIDEMKDAMTEKVDEKKAKLVDTVHKEVHKAAGIPESTPEEIKSVQDTNLDKRFFKKNGESLG